QGVNVVFTGHEHFYERIAPQHGIYYFILGCSGELRPGDIRASALTQKGFDTDRAFMMVEISGNELFFQAISRTGESVDSGMLAKQPKPDEHSSDSGGSGGGSSNAPNNPSNKPAN